MQALYDLPAPNNTITSIHEFYDATESHIRGATNKRKWNIKELCAAIHDELYILEIGSQPSNIHTSLPPTTLFVSTTSKPTSTPKGKL